MDTQVPLEKSQVEGLELEEDNNASGSSTAQKTERNANEAVNRLLVSDQNVEAIRGPSISAEKRNLPLEANESSSWWLLPVIALISVVLSTWLVSVVI